MMQSKGLMKRAVYGAAAVAAVLFAGAAQAALQDRDLNGDKVVDAFYDTDLNITWLRNANVNGLMNWDTAVAWANGYSFGGYSDWRLPSDSSEIGHLWRVDLGNGGGAPWNAGNFQNLKADGYWTGLDSPRDSSLAYAFHTVFGWQYPEYKATALYALAVRPGDVAPVPEPETYALMLAGLTAVAVVARRRPR